MAKIKAYDDKALRKSTRVAAVIAGIALIALSICSSVKYSAIIGVVLLLAVVFGKETYATEEGISVEYDFSCSNTSFIGALKRLRISIWKGSVAAIRACTF